MQAICSMKSIVSESMHELMCSIYNGNSLGKKSKTEKLQNSVLFGAIVVSKPIANEFKKPVAKNMTAKDLSQWAFHVVEQKYGTKGNSRNIKANGI